ncbi:cold shock domain-containing protein [Phaeovibrio sulfidiphilus]|uniref:Cold shock domain-containing protein n=1 Tax=Phaeovibrio sulfidiphilus TaxID=1220600 RepID=A0A8J7CNY3_9PROT|nr:cold shock domain-containing protein [Phaeovibrio sulfidiphilus]MBE1236422.1 cold shock domain-containing protein [Phaeovibrio sulfidiphilus]
MHKNMTVTLKWFNQTKGFGFVRIHEGDPDAFLHVSVLQRAGYETLPDGSVIICDLEPSQKGLQVAEIHSVEVASPGAGGAYMDDLGGSLSELQGTVKFFSPEKGFGFVLPDNGGKDVFLPLRTLQNSGLDMIETGQKVHLEVREGKKGPMAERVCLL